MPKKKNNAKVTKGFVVFDSIVMEYVTNSEKLAWSDDLDDAEVMSEKDAHTLAAYVSMLFLRTEKPERVNFHVVPVETKTEVLTVRTTKRIK